MLGFLHSAKSHTSDLKNGTPVATLPGAWQFGVSTGTGGPSISILWMGEIANLICNLHLNVAAHTIVLVDTFLKYASMFLGS